MNDAYNPYRTWGTLAADAEVSDRARFIRLTYLHLAGAVAAFIGLEAILLSIPAAVDMALQVATSRFGWLLVLGGFMGVSHVANAWANSSTSKPMQYAGLGIYVVAQAIVMLPLLAIAQRYEVGTGTNIISLAAVLTLVVFTALTAVVFISGADFSFLSGALALGTIVALITIVCSILFGFNLGILFIGALLLLSGGYILYDTSNVMHHYQIGQHVAAALALFAAVALMFWYMIQLVLSLSSRD